MVIEVSDVHEEGAEAASPVGGVRRWWAWALAAALTVAGVAGYAGADVGRVLPPTVCLPGAPVDPVILAGNGTVTGKVTFTCVASGRYAADVSIALDYSSQIAGDVDVVVQSGGHQVNPLVFTVSRPCRVGRWSVDVSFTILPRQNGSSQEIIAFPLSATNVTAANCRAAP